MEYVRTNYGQNYTEVVNEEYLDEQGHGVMFVTRYYDDGDVVTGNINITESGEFFYADEQ